MALHKRKGQVMACVIAAACLSGPVQSSQTGPEAEREIEAVTEMIDEIEPVTAKVDMFVENECEEADRGTVGNMLTETTGFIEAEDNGEQSNEITQNDWPQGLIEDQIGSDDETEPVSQAGTDSQVETEKQIETELQTEKVHSGHWVVHVTDLTLEGEDSRVYDGTTKAEIRYRCYSEFVCDDGEILLTEDNPYDDQIQAELLSCELASPNAGRQRVVYQFALSRAMPKGAELRVDSQELFVKITPVKLQITLPDGWKYYHAPADMENIHLLGKVRVSGFLTDRSGVQLVPDGFVLPEVTVSERLTTDTPLYRDGMINRVQGALTVKTRDDGSVVGSTGSENYVFDLSGVSGGMVTMTKASVRKEIDYTVDSDLAVSCVKNGILYIRGNQKPVIHVNQDSGYNRAVWVSSAAAVLQKISGGVLTAQSEPFPVSWQNDSTGPVYQILMSSGRQYQGAIYAAGSARVTLTAPRDGESGLSYASYEVYRYEGRNTLVRRGSFEDGAVVSLSGEGRYTVVCRAADQVGNLTEISSSQIILDSTPPVIDISGVTDGTESTVTVSPRIHVSDDCLDTGSIEAVLTGSGSASGVRVKGTVVKDSGGAVVTFPLLSGNGQSDGRYTVHILAVDLAGNRSYEMVSFTLNRSGPVYELSPAASEALSSYWHHTPFAVALTAQDWSEAVSAYMLCLKDNTSFTLSPGKGLTVSSVVSGSGKIITTYTAPAAAFSSDGRYELVLISTDAAGHSKNSADVLTVCFGIDASPPDCVITGISKGQILESDSVMIALQPRDNLTLAGLSLYVNGQKVLEQTGEQIASSGGVVKYRLSGGEDWQRIRACVWDEAGNLAWTEEIPVLIRKVQTSALPDGQKSSSGRKMENESLPDSKAAADLALELEKSETEMFEAEEDKQSAVPGGEKQLEKESYALMHVTAGNKADNSEEALKKDEESETKQTVSEIGSIQEGSNHEGSIHEYSMEKDGITQMRSDHSVSGLLRLIESAAAMLAGAAAGILVCLLTRRMRKIMH